jgi:hypothetical protein
MNVLLTYQISDETNKLARHLKSDSHSLMNYPFRVNGIRDYELSCNSYMF